MFYAMKETISNPTALLFPNLPHLTTNASSLGPRFVSSLAYCGNPELSTANIVHTIDVCASCALLRFLDISAFPQRPSTFF